MVTRSLSIPDPKTDSGLATALPSQALYFIGRLLLICAAGLVVAWCMASFWFPFGWDQGFFAAVGDVILRGGMPYRDGWEIKGPLTYYVFALAQQLFGRHMWSIRILDLPLLLAGMAALARMVKRIASPAAGWWAAIVLALWVASLTWFHTIQPDGWAADLILLGAAPLVAGRSSLRVLLWAGATIGCAGLVKPIYLGFIVVPLLQIAMQPRTRETSQRLVLGAYVVSITLLPPVLAAAWFAHRGALNELVDVHLLYNLQVYSAAGSEPIADRLRGVLRFFLKGPLVWALPVIGAGVSALWRNSRQSALLLVTWITVAVSCVAAQGKFYKYHWIVVFPPLTALGVLGFRWLLAEFGQPLSQAPALRKALCGLLLALAGVGIFRLSLAPAEGANQWLSLMTGRMGIEQYYASYAAAGYVAGDNIKAADYIRERTSAADGLAVWGNEAVLNFLAARPNPTRFVYAMPLTEGGPGSIRDRYRREYVAALDKQLPAYFVVGTPWGSGNKEQSLSGFPELAQILHDRYSFETEFGKLDLYRRN